MTRYRQTLENTFRDYVQSIICGLIGKFLLEGKIEPLDCQTTEDYEIFLDSLYEKCLPSIYNSIKQVIEKNTTC